MKLSILDQSPISSNQTAREALLHSVELAQLGECLGYSRYWIAEHHDLPGIACSAPEVMLSYIGANTNKIRIGSGAVLLPYYKPYKVAEVYHMLATLFPNRIDIGIGRAPGGSAEATNALSDHFLQQVWKMPQLVKDLLHFINNDFPEDHEFAKIKASPLPEIPPEPWLLGTGKKSALLAAENGLPYAFGKFMSDKDGISIIQEYIESFKPRKLRQRPKVIVTVSVICAETNKRAEELALSSLIWSLQKEKGSGQHGTPSLQEAKQYVQDQKEKSTLFKLQQNMVIGNPHVVKQKLEEIQALYQADEIMLLTIMHSPKDRIESYRLIAEEIINQ